MKRTAATTERPIAIPIARVLMRLGRKSISSILTYLRSFAGVRKVGCVSQRKYKVSVVEDTVERFEGFGF
ncbi:hypothetical protein KC333_g30 [Hortaea werneckii]|nr:hypothetical protein KC333_g30 [Hortaea werneckii]